jgi:hypothetical protein
MTESTPDTRTQNTEPERPDPSPGSTPPPAEGDTAPTEHQLDAGSASQTAGGAGGITDDQLPEDLQPTDDNPLAKPLPDGDDRDAGLSLGADGPQS